MAFATTAPQAALVSLTGLEGGGTSYTLFTPLAAGGSGGAILGSLTGAPAGLHFLSNSNVSGGPFTFCVELEQTASLSTTNAYTVQDPFTGHNTPGGAPAANTWGSNAYTISLRVDRLLSYAMGVLGANTTGAATIGSLATSVLDDLGAVQMALWNAIYDGDGDVTAGTFSAVTTTAIDQRANYILAQALTYAGPTTHYYVLTNDTLQDVLAAPTPGSLSLAALALVGASLARRRASARAA